MKLISILLFASLILSHPRPAQASSITDRSNSLKIDADGCPVSLQVGQTVMTMACNNVGTLTLGEHAYPLAYPTKIENVQNTILVTYFVPAKPSLEVGIHYNFSKHDAIPVLTRTFSVRRTDGLKSLPADLSVSLLHVPFTVNTNAVWVPNKNGTGQALNLTITEVSYKAAGRVLPGHDLALPLIVSRVEGVHNKPLALFADPYFSTVMNSNSTRWTYAHQVGLEDGIEKRKLFSAFLNPNSDIHALTDGAIHSFYKTALPDVPAGHKWLKEISMVSYDYMSDDGNGWKRDIDALVRAVPLEKRHKIMLTLHGWYDLDGRFAFTPGNKTLDDSWPNYISPKAGVMTIANIRERLKYAKDRGFKIAIYAINGVNSASHSLVSIAQNPDHILRKLTNGWRGPDMLGSPAVNMNPAHPAVRAFYLDLVNAEVNAFGDLVDAYVNDETFYIRAGELGTARVPGYVDRAYMRLVKDITKLIHSKYPNAAFLTSDAIGAVNGNVPPYALFADGTYQDARVEPRAWSYAIFPNYRNTVFSCNWHGIRHYNKMEYGVRNFQAPVVFTNGWEDSYGFGEMTDADREKHVRLFDWRSEFQTKFHWFEELPPFNPVQ